MKKWMFGFSVLLLLAGCKTTEVETRPISYARQQAYLKRLRDPRVYGLSIYQTPGGPQIRGGGRLHPNQALALPMMVEEPLRPAVVLKASFGKEYTVLLDPCSQQTCFEFSAAQELGAEAVGEREPTLVKLPGEEVGACLSVIPSLRFGQLYVEKSLLFVRLADGFIGPLARGIEEPELKGVIGWSSLKNFEQIRLLYSAGQVLLYTTEEYDPDPAQVLTTLPIVQHAGVCVVRATVDGKETMVLMDPAGDFEVAADAAVASIQLGDGLTLDAPAVSESPGGTRLGAHFLKQYDVTICPKAGMVYFEKLTIEEEK